MNTLDAIASRRSIRKFKETPIPDDALQKILTAAIQAPSGGNSQPWRFVVVREDKRAEMLKVFRDKLAERNAAGEPTAMDEGTAGFMEQASVTVFVFNAEGMHPTKPRTTEEEVLRDVVNIQAIGASIQNMLLAAQDLGIGSLWIGRVFKAYDELCEWLGEESQMVAAVSFGYPGENPESRPRKPLREVACYK